MSGQAPPRVAAGILFVIVSAAILAPFLAPYDPYVQLEIVTQKNLPPSLSHWLGTDPFSRDILSRLLFGARASLAVAFVATAVALLVGTAWGMIAGWATPWLARAFIAGMDVYRSLPRILVLLAAFMLFGALSPLLLALALGLSIWPVMAIVCHLEVRRVRATSFIEASTALGSGRLAIVVRHTLPHVIGPLSAAAVPMFADIMLLEAGLSFVGLGVRPPYPSWGGMVQDGLPFLGSAWWVTLVPASALVATVLAVSSIANWADERRVSADARAQGAMVR